MWLFISLFFCKNIIDFFWFLWISPDFFHFSDFSGFLLISLDFSWFLKLCTWFSRVIYPSFKSSMNSYYDVSSIWGALILKYRPMWLFHFFLNSFVWTISKLISLSLVFGDWCICSGSAWNVLSIVVSFVHLLHTSFNE